MADLDPARREELAVWLRNLDFDVPSDDADALAPLIARWLADARAESAAEERVRLADFFDRVKARGREHAAWGTDPSGYCGCGDCNASDDPTPEETP